ncbi:MAG TPA: DNA polymerase III subunit, partial [Phototrophicaceae bacterium]|nr:DNA polymerase III subunit [Phototrophicaceae bacterium]
MAKKKQTPIQPTTRELPPHNWKVYGHDWAVDYLRKGIVHNRVRQAYLISGTPNIGKTRFAHAFAMALNCSHEDVNLRPCGECRSCKLVISGNHPDMVYSELDPNTGALKIEALRDVMRRLTLKPYEGRHRVAIISDFDRARGQAQDAILKTLEEPPPYAVILLLASSTEQTLSTITSRCQVVYLRPAATDVIRDTLINQYGAEAEHAILLARLSSGRIGWAIEALQDDAVLTQRETALNLLEEVIAMNRTARFDLAGDLSKDKNALPQLLELWQTYWRDLMLHAAGSPVKPANSDRLTHIERLMYKLNTEDAFQALKATQTLLSQLATNTNLRLALEVMMLGYPGLS